MKWNIQKVGGIAGDEIILNLLKTQSQRLSCGSSAKAAEERV